jgi:hypothetical protein
MLIMDKEVGCEVHSEERRSVEIASIARSRNAVIAGHGGGG